eukprot:TRINITY_DN923_c0_g3_i3.p1 TRINITY_DN923_c0_g3~~TRINITY_DN923_c0_g3_i3.p1  ORF type:complete len:199 (+),score=27.90 TRINITY_DN923_c0_g3_i3:214-810(+)
MDTMAALALGTEKPQERLLYRKPYGREGKLITATMWRNIFGQSFFQVLIMCLLLYVIDPDTRRHYLWNDIESGQFIEGPNLHYTFIFNTFVFLQVFNEINSRKVNKEFNVFSGIFSNGVFVGIILITIVVQILMVEYGGQAVSTVPLLRGSIPNSAYYWGWSVLLGSMSLPVGFLLRLIPVKLEAWEVEVKPPRDNTL